MVVQSYPAALADKRLYGGMPLDQYLATLSPREEGDAFTVILNLAGAAFQDPQDSGQEVACILRKLADKLEGGYTMFPQILDANGNACGEAGYFDAYPLK